MQNFGEQIRCIMGDVQVAFSRNKKERLKYAAGKKWGLLRIRFCLQQEEILVYNKYPSIK